MDFALSGEMDSQPTEGTPAAPAVLSLPLSAPPTAGGGILAITLLLDAPLVAAWNQFAIVTQTPFSILGDDDPEGEFPPLNSRCQIRTVTNGKKRALEIFRLGAAATKPTTSPRYIQRCSNPDTSSLEDGWHRVSRPHKTVLSAAASYQHRSALSSPTLSFYDRPNHAASWTRRFS